MGDNFWDVVSDKKEDAPAPESLNPEVSERDLPQKMDQLWDAPASEIQPSPEVKEGSQWSELEKEDGEASQGSGNTQAWFDDKEADAGIWASIGLSLAFTVVIFAGIFFVTLLASGTFEDHSMKDMPQVEARLLEMSSYTDTICNEDGGCSDTLYVEALLVLHCTNEEGDTWACGPEKSERSFPFYFTYDSGFFEPVPAEHMDESAEQDTHTVAYDPMDPTRVDLQPGFQFNFEWAIPVFFVLCAGFAVGRAIHRSDYRLKEGYINLYKLMTGKIRV